MFRVKNSSFYSVLRHYHSPSKEKKMLAKLPLNQDQGSYLYDGEWSKEIDMLFIEVISFQHEIGNFTFGAKNYSAIGLTIDTINRQHGKHFSYKYCELKVNHLFKRYNTFAWMLSLTEVMYDEVTKHVHAPNRMWDFIIQVLHSNVYVLINIFNLFH